MSVRIIIQNPKLLFSFKKFTVVFRLISGLSPRGRKEHRESPQPTWDFSKELWLDWGTMGKGWLYVERGDPTFHEHLMSFWDQVLCGHMETACLLKLLRFLEPPHEGRTGKVIMVTSRMNNCNPNPGVLPSDSVCQWQRQDGPGDPCPPDPSSQSKYCSPSHPQIQMASPLLPFEGAAWRFIYYSNKWL